MKAQKMKLVRHSSPGNLKTTSNAPVITTSRNSPQTTARACVCRWRARQTFTTSIDVTGVSASMAIISHSQANPIVFTLNNGLRNGSVTVALPADASTDVKVTTVNGGISTAFPISVSGKVDPRRLNGTIGAGGRAIEIETVNGSVTLRKQN